jgi:hypothetical protein
MKPHIPVLVFLLMASFLVYLGQQYLSEGEAEDEEEPDIPKEFHGKWCFVGKVHQGNQTTYWRCPQTQTELEIEARQFWESSLGLCTPLIIRPSKNGGLLVQSNCSRDSPGVPGIQTQRWELLDDGDRLHTRDARL